MSDCRQLGATGHCVADRHDRCAYRAGGPLQSGIRLPEGYVTAPSGVVAVVVRPSHIYRCPCSCHAMGQLDLFGVAS